MVSPAIVVNSCPMSTPVFPMLKCKKLCLGDNPKGSKIRKTSKSFADLPLGVLILVFAFTDYRDRESHMRLSKEIAAIIGHYVFGISKTIRPATLYQLWVQYGTIPIRPVWGGIIDYMCPDVKSLLPLETRQALQPVKILTLAGGNNGADFNLSEFPNGVYFKLRGLRIPNEMGEAFDGKHYNYEEIKFISCHIYIDFSILFSKCPLLQLVTCINSSHDAFREYPSLRKTRLITADGKITVITRV